jgi:hypothetical protein
VVGDPDGDGVDLGADPDALEPLLQAVSDASTKVSAQSAPVSRAGKGNPL